MAFLDSFADRCFKTDSEGRTIFYRGRLFWGVKGYIVPDESRKQQIHRFVRHYYTVTLIGPFLLALVSIILVPFLVLTDGHPRWVSWASGHPRWVFWAGVISLGLVVGLVCQVWYILSTARLVRGLLTTHIKYPLGERLKDSAKSVHIVFWWIALASSVLLTGQGVGALLKGRESVYAILGNIALFGGFSMWIVYMIWLKKRGGSYDGVEDETQQNLRS